VRLLVWLLAVGLGLGGVSSASARQLGPPWPAASASAFGEYWVAAHAETGLWSEPGTDSARLGDAYQLTVFKVVAPQRGERLYVWDPRSDNYAWVDADDVGAVDPGLAGGAHLPPLGARVRWAGEARVTMYSCVELGGCAATASGLWPEPGLVAVDPRVIPVGSMIWIEGLGTFQAADTGSLVKGAHVDVFTTSYPDAVAWGVRRLPILVLE
jgi:3D (Asp-Asp-Asp) domain-containing protein